MRVVGESKSLLGHAEDVSVEPMVRVLVMQDNNPVASFWKVRKGQHYARVAGNRYCSPREGPLIIFGPTSLILEDCSTNHTFAVSEAVDMNCE